VSGGGDTTCGIGRDTGTGIEHALLCWGRNDFAQTGSAASATPAVTMVSTKPNAPQVEVGFQFACAMIDPGVPYCWGRNHLGQMGRGTVTETAAPAAVSSFTIRRTFTGADPANGDDPDAQP
jgi:alpha-tubulin suppressor-like RCC1 family protein